MITHLFRRLLPLLSLCLLCCCSDDEETGGIRLAGDMSAHQTIYADETTIEDGSIEFVTVGPWTAEVTEAYINKAEGDKVDWISLSQYSGDKAGDHAIQVSLSKNFTGVDRKACIQITSGSAVTITIE